MEIFLSNQCKSLTGQLGRQYGYSIQKRGKRFFSKRNSRGNVPLNAHLKFILSCADVARLKLHICDIAVSQKELREALIESKHFIAAHYLRLPTYNARDIINLKHTFGL